MKIAITGHTSGIGKELHKLYPDSAVFSRSNNFDLSIPQLRQRMYSEVEECDVFINNAPIGIHQSTLLTELWQLWKDKDRIIINIGSDASDYKNEDEYSTYKRILQDACLTLQHTSALCKTILIKPGYVDTPRVSSITTPKINPTDFALYIQELIECNDRSFWIPAVTLYPR